MPASFPDYYRTATGRRLSARPGSSFVVLGLFLAWRCEVAPEDATEFLGRFGTTEDVADAHERLFPRKEA